MQSGYQSYQRARVLRRLAAAGAAIVMASLLGACTTVKVSPDQFIVPDSRLIAAKRPVPSHDLRALRERVPVMQLEERDFRTEDGLPLRAVVYRHPAAQATVLLYGNSGFRVAQQGQVLLKALAPMPVNVVQFDYRGYGRSGGTPTVDNMQRDALAVFDQVRKDMPGPVIVHGHSFGTFIAGWVASQRKADGLVLEGASTSAEDFARNATPWYARPFVRLDIEPVLLDIDNRRFLKAHEGALLVLTGENDRITPPAHGRQLYEAASTRTKAFHPVPGAGHMDSLAKPEASAAYAKLIASLGRQG